MLSAMFSSISSAFSKMEKNIISGREQFEKRRHAQVRESVRGNKLFILARVRALSRNSDPDPGIGRKK